jgi:hypothetical protein
VVVLRLEDGERVCSYTDPNHYLGPFAWSPDGDRLALVRTGRQNGYGGSVTLHEKRP